MFKKLLALAIIAGAAVVVKQKLDQQGNTKDLWAQAVDQPKN